MPLFEERLNQGHSVVFMPRGTSMLPMIHQGVDHVTLSPLPPELRKYDLPLYRRDNGQFVLHRILEAGDTYTCCGDNQFEMECGIRPDQFIGLVTAFTRKGRTVSVEDPRYRFYCRFWHCTRPVRHFKRRVCGKLRRIFSHK